MRYDFPVPALPETIILRGGGLMADWCCWTVVYTSQVGRISCGGEDMLSSCLSLLCNEGWGFIDVRVRLGSKSPVNVILGFHARL